MDSKANADSAANTAEWKLKYFGAIEVQNSLEQELEQSVQTTLETRREAKALKQKNQELQQDVAQLTQQLINGQGQSLDQISQLSEEVSRLRDKNRALQVGNENLQQKLDKAVESKLAAPTYEQENVLNRELRAHHEKLKTEIDQVRQINERLIQENDSLQILVGEKTITGEAFEEFDGQTLEHELIESNLEFNDTNDLEFRLKSAQNYIQALKLSLESLVQRLLENKEYERAVEKNIGSRKISAFTERRKQAETFFVPPKLAPGSKAQWPLGPLAHSKRAKQRIVSMGVDDSIDDSMSDSSTLADMSITVAKRPTTSNQTQLRKLSLS